MPGAFTPTLVEGIVRLGAWMPFVPASQGLAFFLKVTVSPASARRKTEAAGAAYVEVQTETVEALEAAIRQGQLDEPEPSSQAPKPRPALQQLSVDGAMVPLLHKEWSEVKTLVIGTVEPPKWRDGELVVHTSELSYFSRLTDHETFGRLATFETQRRQTLEAKTVVAVNDGALWEQGFVDLQRPDAVRILDFSHCVGYLAEIAQALYGPGTPASQEWLQAKRHELRHGSSQTLLAELAQRRDELAASRAAGPEAEPPSQSAAKDAEVSLSQAKDDRSQDREAKALEILADKLEYLQKREAQIRYAEFEQAGYPIGSGAVESGNKLVVEARLKGAGMHWARGNVDAMLALRNIVCSDRWDEAWPIICERLRHNGQVRAAQGRTRRRAAKAAVPERDSASAARDADESGPATASLARSASLPAPTMPIETEPQAGLPSPAVAIATPRSQSPTKPVSHRPAANHPWRHMPIGKARRR